MRVIAFDGGVPSLTATATLTISLVDVNDNTPIFSPSTYTWSVAENSAIGSYQQIVFYQFHLIIELMQ